MATLAIGRSILKINGLVNYYAYNIDINIFICFGNPIQGHYKNNQTYIILLNTPT